jgi:acyl carrier protein
MLRRELLFRFGVLAAAAQLGWPSKGLAMPQAGSGNSNQKESTSTVEAKIKQIIVEQLQVDEKNVIPTAKLQGDLGADSLDIVELAMQMEETFDLQIPDEEVCKWKTVGDIARSVQADIRKKQTKQPSK